METNTTKHMMGISGYKTNDNITCLLKTNGQILMDKKQVERRGKVSVLVSVEKNQFKYA